MKRERELEIYCLNIVSRFFSKEADISYKNLHERKGKEGMNAAIVPPPPEINMLRLL
jgi:hypothetical protein